MRKLTPSAVAIFVSSLHELCAQLETENTTMCFSDAAGLNVDGAEFTMFSRGGGRPYLRRTSGLDVALRERVREHGRRDEVVGIPVVPLGVDAEHVLERAVPARRREQRQRDPVVGGVQQVRWARERVLGIE